MPSIPPELLSLLQGNTKNIRNICIVAHVDHGKTTLSDSLISSNGIISPKLAGKVKYLDSRPDEQERRITMKSSCISLLYKKKSNPQSQPQTQSPTPSELKSEESQPPSQPATVGAQNMQLDQAYIVNLIDSPGHVDFSSEVSSAVRLSDGCLVLVDALEGVCIQTHAVLRQAWSEKVRPCLVINKVDRLITELQLTPLEAYHHLRKVLEQVNFITGELFSEEWMKEIEERQALTEEDRNVLDMESLEPEESVYFSPEKGNVVFASAIDLWAFRIEHFSDLYAQKLGVKREILQKSLWGEYYFNPKTKRIHTKNVTGKLAPMFVHFVLNNIWEVYNAAGDKTKIDKIINALKLKIPPRDLASDDPKAVAQAILCKWLPMSDTLLEMVVEKLPSPIEAQALRIPKLWQPSVGATSEMSTKQHEIQDQMMTCDPQGEVVIFVSKVVSHGAESVTRRLSQPKPRSQKTEESSDVVVLAPPKQRDESKDRFVGFARIFSGTIRRGQKLHVLGPKYNPFEPNKHHSVIDVEELYILMGKELEPTDHVPAGNIFGIGNVEEHIFKTATLCTSQLMPTFNTMTFASMPIVRVAVESENLSDMPKLFEGLKILNQSDPSVEVLVQESGEHVIVAAGELHLERCLRDLRETFAKVPIRVSSPIVAFRETVTSDPSSKFPVHKEVHTANHLGTIKVRAVPIPEEIRKLLEANAVLVRKIFVDESVDLKENVDVVAFRDQLMQVFKTAGDNWEKELPYLWSFGPRRIGPNILLNHIPSFSNSPTWEPLIKKIQADYQPKNVAAEGKLDKSKTLDMPTDATELTDDTAKVLDQTETERLLKDLNNSIVTGFQLATSSGPLCEEPMSGVCFIVDDIILREGELDSRGPFTGQIISAVKEACRQAFLSRSVRLIQAMYFCYIQVPPEYMGKMFGVLGRRRAKILKEEQKEGTSIFSIEALLPVVESFGLSVELLTETSGSASTQLIFHGWETLDQDPYYVPVTEEELEEFGENVGGFGANIALQYMNAVRRRKGLSVDEQIVKHANKQRTRHKKK